MRSNFEKEYIYKNHPHVYFNTLKYLKFRLLKKLGLCNSKFLTLVTLKIQGGTPFQYFNHSVRYKIVETVKILARKFLFIFFLFKFCIIYFCLTKNSTPSFQGQKFGSLCKYQTKKPCQFQCML